MSGLWTVVAVAVAWFVLGAAIGIWEARHGHWRHGWLVTGLLGPLALPLALHARRVAAPEPVVLDEGGAARGSLDVLVGIDGSAHSVEAAQAAVELLGSAVGRLTLATVLDVDTARPPAERVLHPQPYPEEVEARQVLDALAAAPPLARLEPGSVLLAGEPAEALARYASDEGYHLIVVGRRGRGWSKRLFGSCASALARDAAVPVLLVPGSAAAPADAPDARHSVHPHAAVT